MSHKSLLTLSLIITILSCKGYDSYEYLNGDFIAKGSQLPATLVNPANNGNISLTTQFLWTSAGDARSYRIEISTAADVSSPVLKATVKSAQYTIQTSDLIGASSLPEQTYYWRVVTVYPTKEEISPIFKFVLYDKDIIYVDISSGAAQQLGNLTAPFKSIQIAINFALANGRIMVCVSKGTYNEAITLGLGIKHQGGYDASANWGRNIALNVTTISSAGLTTVTSPMGATSGTTIDGFTILNVRVGGVVSQVIYNSSSSPTISNNTISGGNATNNYGIYNEISSSPMITVNTITQGGSGAFTENYGIYNTSSSPTISNNTINGGSGNNGYGIYNAVSSSPTISNNTITGGFSNSCAGLVNSGSSPTISNNIITGGCPINGYGIKNSGGSPTISNNTITGGNGGGGGPHIGINNDTSSSVISNNTIIGGNSTSTNYGIWNGNPSSATIANNTINGGTAGVVYAIYTGVSTPIIKNNILFCSGGTTRYGVWEYNAASDPAAFQNNDSFGCTTALYADYLTAATGGNCPADVTRNCYTLLADINNSALTTQGAAATSQGNVIIDNTAGQLFININGPDGNIATMADNDWHLQPASAANCNVLFGGLDLSVSFANDKDNITPRTAIVAGLPCTRTAPSDTLGAGWSMGAYEKN